MQGEGRGQHLREKLPGVGELLDFFPWDGRRVPSLRGFGDSDRN